MVIGDCRVLGVQSFRGSVFQRPLEEPLPLPKVFSRQTLRPFKNPEPLSAPQPKRKLKTTSTDAGLYRVLPWALKVIALSFWDPFFRVPKGMPGPY